MAGIAAWITPAPYQWMTCAFGPELRHVALLHGTHVQPERAPARGACRCVGTRLRCPARGGRLFDLSRDALCA